MPALQDLTPISDQSRRSVTQPPSFVPRKKNQRPFRSTGTAERQREPCTRSKRALLPTMRRRIPLFSDTSSCSFFSSTSSPVLVGEWLHGPKEQHSAMMTIAIVMRSCRSMARRLRALHRFGSTVDDIQLEKIQKKKNQHVQVVALGWKSVEPKPGAQLCSRQCYHLRRASPDAQGRVYYVSSDVIPGVRFDTSFDQESIHVHSFFGRRVRDVLQE